MKRVCNNVCARAGIVVFAAGVLGVTGTSQAWLGGFEAADGYEPFLNRVQEYNAGQYGANSGYAGSFTPIATNTGLWEALAGGFSSGGSTSYATGHQNYDHTWVNSGNTSGAASDQALVLTTGHEGWTGPALKYRYNVDAQDLGGFSPAATGSTQVNMSFWWCAQLAGPEVGGEIADGYFGDEIQFVDSAGNIGFTLGLTQRASGDKVTYWDGTSMVESSIIAASNRYDRWDISLDLVNDTFSASYYQFSTATTFNLVTNASMMSAMSEFDNMTFRTSPGVQNSKLMSVDDFGFDVRQVPAPGVMTLLGVGAVATGRRKR